MPFRLDLLRTPHPNRMSRADLAALAQSAQQNRPRAFGYAAAHYRGQLDLLSGPPGNKALTLAVAGGGAKLPADRAGRREAGPSGGDRG